MKHLIFPQVCPVCGRLSVSYCDTCLESVTEKLESFCSECGGNWNQSQCKGAFTCYCSCLYEGYAKEFLLNLKYRNCRSLGIAIGNVMGMLLPRCEADMILPVPLHRESSRFFNQSELIARGISEVWKIPVGLELSWTEKYGRQVEKRAGERKSLPLSAIKCNPVSGKKIILVDDVYTTGSTIRAAAEAVKRADGTVCCAYFWCRTVKHGDIQEFADVEDALSLQISRS